MKAEAHQSLGTERTAGTRISEGVPRSAGLSFLATREKDYVQAPCLLGQPAILTVAHVFCSCRLLWGRPGFIVPVGKILTARCREQATEAQTNNGSFHCCLNLFVMMMMTLSMLMVVITVVMILTYYCYCSILFL